MHLKEFIESFIGKTENEAKEIALFNGYTPRVRKKDSQSFIGTSDFKMNRVNLIIENDLVIEANFG